MIIQKFAQSTFLIKSTSGKVLLIDPGLYNFTNEFKAETFGKVDILIITHKHSDHFDLDAIKSIVTLHSPTILTNHEISDVLQSETIGSTVAWVGDRFNFEGFTLVLTKTDHVVRGEAVANFGLVIESDKKRIYYTSDTRLIDLSLLPYDKVTEPDILCVPISNRGLVMGIDDALYFTNEIRPKTVIPMHYDSPKDKDRVRPEHFISRLNMLKASLNNLCDVKVKVLSFGDEVEIE